MKKVEYFENGAKQVVFLFGKPQEIRDKLTKEGKIVISVKEQRRYFWQRKVNRAELSAVLKAMSDLLNSGVRLSMAISSVLSTELSPQTRNILLVMLNAVNEGKEISSAMDNKVFGRTILSMIKAGERAGKLADTIDLASEHIKTIGKIKKEMYKRITYPAIILCIGVASLLLNTLIVIPKIISSELFQMTLKGEEPFSVNILRFFSWTIPSFIAFIVLLIIATVIYYKSNQEKAEKYLIKIPFVREFLFYRDFFISFLGLSKLLESGERLDSAIEIVGESASFHIVKQDFKNAWENLKGGKSFVEGLKNLTTIEKVMLGTSLNIENIQKTANIVSERFYNKYEEKLKGLAPKVYAGVMIFTIFLFILVGMSVMVPYGRILSGIHG